MTTQPKLHHGVVLVVDDDPGVREALTDVLTDEGYQVLCACDGREALELLATDQALCLILLDLTMPRVSGWEVLEELATDPVKARIPVIVLTGASPYQLASVAAPAVLRKPVDLNSLLKAVETYC